MPVENNARWLIIEAALQALASLMIEDEAHGGLSEFQEYLEHGEYALALNELAAVVNGRAA